MLGKPPSSQGLDSCTCSRGAPAAQPALCMSLWYVSMPLPRPALAETGAYGLCGKAALPPAEALSSPLPPPFHRSAWTDATSLVVARREDLACIGVKGHTIDAPGTVHTLILRAICSDLLCDLHLAQNDDIPLT